MKICELRKKYEVTEIRKVIKKCKVVKKYRPIKN